MSKLLKLKGNEGKNTLGAISEITHVHNIFNDHINKAMDNVAKWEELKRRVDLVSTYEFHVCDLICCISIYLFLHIIYKKFMVLLLFGQFHITVYVINLKVENIN